jgi:hypothetical protein
MVGVFLKVFSYGLSYGGFLGGVFLKVFTALARGMPGFLLVFFLLKIFTSG